MPDELGIGRIKRLDDHPSRNGHRKNGGKGKKFSLDNVDKDEKRKVKNKRSGPVSGKENSSPATEGPEEGKIDIIV